MKTVIKSALSFVFLIIVLTIFGLLSGTVPPMNMTAQVEKLPPEKRMAEEREMTVDSMLSLINMAYQDSVRLATYLQGVKDGRKSKPKKQTPKVVFRKKIVEVPAEPEVIYKDSVFVSNGVGVEKPLIIYKEAPSYGRNVETKYLTFSEWREQTGKSSDKEYKQYLKNLNVLK